MFAQIVLERSHKDLDRIFHYKIPENMVLTVGMRVNIPFGAGNKEIVGHVAGFSERVDFDEKKLKYVSRALDSKPVITEELLRLAEWMKEKYYCTLADCVNCIIPSGMGFGFRRSADFASLNITAEEAAALAQKDSHQSRILTLLLENGEMSVNDLRACLGISLSPIKTLQKKGLISIERIEVLRDTVEEHAVQTSPPDFTPSQRFVLNFIADKRDKKPVLIHGVTGSGKTEIYMELVRRTIDTGKQAIMLVPEISLTPQTVALFVGRFGHRVSVTHSRLSMGERCDQWKKARDGLISVMIGPRSAVFAPFKNLGLIIIDEEHENTYKSEATPKYSAKEVAIHRAEANGALVVLGSATPSIETYYEAQAGEIDLVSMPNRINEQMPEVRVVDMRHEFAEGNKSVFSGALLEALTETLSRNKQAILFLNRRGHSTFVSCRRCGTSLRCVNCSVNYTYHMYNSKLICHYCGDRIENPKNCPVCGSKYIRYFGIGTQRVEEEVGKLFPEARVLRMDFDTTAGKYSHDRILTSFRKGEADILVGTQMIAKGLDFPNVTLVGVIAADLSLNNGDYRSAEITYQLLAQVSGRAGRAEAPGQVVVQSYNPQHYAISAAAENDYEGFYSHEIGLRRQMAYPPFTKIFAIVFTGEGEKKLIINMFKLLDIMKFYNRKGLFETIGPAPAMISKIRKRYRWRMVVKSEDEEKLKLFVFYCLDKLKKSEDLSEINISVTLNPALLV